ncbi:polysaccharide biosynthesis protein [Candidatus Vecturithrix granuli]|uniref:Polysaccharide biosynthesis protein n=1 Tax=Vecturithrix granuli TaxID=1499967 RepID=A0A081C7W1_VECG1|nr:polysaccharide biosynthesis protein [Candidatus Vecturithrix granuli]
MSFLGSFVRDSVVYAIPSMISRGLSIFLVPLYTRVLTPDDYGALDLLTAFASLVNLTVALEVSQGVARYYAGEQNTDRKVVYASSAFWFTVFCYTVFLVVSLFFSSELAILVMGRDGLEVYFQIGVISIGLNGIFYLIQNQFRWELRSRHYAVVSIIVSFVTAGLAVTLAYILKWGLKGLLYGMVGGALVGCIYGLWHLRNSFRFRFQWKRLKEMLLFSAPLVPSGVAVFISHYIDRLMIKHYLSLHEVGLYGIGFRLASVVGLIMVGFQGALTPLVYAHYRDPQTPRQLAQIFRLFLVFALMVFVILSLFAEEILVLMTTRAYYSAAQIVMFLIPAILLSNMYIFAPGIGIAKKTHLILWINLFGAGLNTLFNLLLIPIYGISGAAAATLMGYSCVFVVYMRCSQKFYFVPHEWKRIVIAVILLSGLAYLVPQLSLSTWLVIALKLVGIVAALLVVLLTGLIRMSELRNLQDLIK